MIILSLAKVPSYQFYVHGCTESVNLRGKALGFNQEVKDSNLIFSTYLGYHIPRVSKIARLYGPEVAHSL